MYVGNYEFWYESSQLIQRMIKMQNKKNDSGEWYKELIYVDSFVRHGYHRNAKIEDIRNEEQETSQLEITNK